MLQSVLVSIPIHCLSPVHVLSLLIRKLEEFRAFICGRLSDTGGVHLVSWDLIYKPRFLVGLGLIARTLGRRNAFQRKLVAQMVWWSNSLWAQVVRDKYHILDSWRDYKKPRNCSTIWGKIYAWGQNVCYQFQCLIGAGSSINIIRDPWLSPIPISVWPTQH